MSCTHGAQQLAHTRTGSTPFGACSLPDGGVRSPARERLGLDRDLGPASGEKGSKGRNSLDCIRGKGLDRDRGADRELVAEEDDLQERKHLMRGVGV